MNINDLKIFQSVANSSSTIKTSEKFNYVQSTISKRLLKLEEEFGVILFNRTNKGMSLTKEGEVFLGYVNEILGVAVRMEKYYFSEKSKIRIGGTQMITKNYLQSYFLRDDLYICTASSSELIQQLKIQKLDKIFLNKKLNEENLLCNEVKQEMIVWACSETNNKAFDESVVLVNRDEECPYRQASFDYLEKHKLTNMKIVEIDMLDSFLDMLECEESVAIIPKIMLKIDRNIKKCATEGLSPVKLYSYQLNGSSVAFEL